MRPKAGRHFVAGSRARSSESRTVADVSRWSRMRAPVIAGATGVLACGYVFVMDPSEPGHFPPCPFLTLTGLDCPFCGSLRATHELMHGNVGTAMDYNLVTVLFILPVSLALLIAWTVQRWRAQPFRVETPRWAIVSAALALIAFTVIRNLPGMPWGTTA